MAEADGVETPATWVRLSWSLATWLLLVAMPWLAVAVMWSLTNLVLAPVMLVCTGAYLLLIVPPGRGSRAVVIAGVLLILAALAGTEWCAIIGAERMARAMVAASRGNPIPARVAGPILSGLLAVPLLLAGIRLCREEADARAGLGDALALALVCPAAVLLVRLDVLPLST